MRANAPAGRLGLVRGYDLVLLAEAKRSAARAKKVATSGEPSREAGAAASAILCAAAACQARLSEELASHEYPEHPTSSPPFIKKVRSAKGAAKKWREYLSITAPSLDLDACSEFKHILCLFKIRNHIAHRSARWMKEGDFPRELKHCVDRSVIPIRVSQDANWTSVVFVHEVAGWAFETAQSWFDFTDPFMPAARSVRKMEGDS